MRHSLNHLKFKISLLRNLQHFFLSKTVFVCLNTTGYNIIRNTKQRINIMVMMAFYGIVFLVAQLVHSTVIETVQYHQSYALKLKFCVCITKMNE